METLEELSRSAYYGNTLRNWAIVLVLFAVWFTVLPLVRAFVSRRLRKQTEARPVAALLLVRVLLDGTTRLFMFAVAVYLAMRWLKVPEGLERGVNVAILVVLWLQIALWGTAAVRHAIEAKRGHGLPTAEGAASLNILRFVGLVAVWSVAFLMLLANLGIQIMPLIAGLGIGGIAVALAVQNVLGDLLGSLAIALDKPFKVGDFLILGQELGTVERIGIKSTHLRSLSGELIVLSNGDLLQSRVRNYGRMYERRVVFSVGIVYETPRKLIGEVSALLEQAIRAQPKTRFDRAHFKQFGDFALIYEAVYYVLDADYNTYMNTQQAINLWIVDDFAERGIEFAYPTSKQWNVNLSAPQPENGESRA